MKNNKSYYAIIPANVRYSDIPPNAKLLYGEITALSNEKGYCWASNKYFAELYKVKTQAVSLWVRQLKEKGFIHYEIEQNNIRKIFIEGVYEKSEGWYTKNRKGGIRKIVKGVYENPEHNTTVNNTSNTTVNNSDETSQKTKKPKYSSLGADVLKAFEEVDKKNKTYYGNKTQRASTDFLIEEYGLKKVLEVIAILPQTNQIPYIPKINSPYELKEKWQKLSDALKSKKKQNEIDTKPKWKIWT